MENRIKECQLDLYADRTSAATLRANQLRLWFASMAYVLICALRRIGLVETIFADATCGTIRLKFLKIGALAPTSPSPTKIAPAPRHPPPQRVGSRCAPRSHPEKPRPAPPNAPPQSSDRLHHLKDHTKGKNKNRIARPPLDHPIPRDPPSRKQGPTSQLQATEPQIRASPGNRPQLRASNSRLDNCSPRSLRS